jgi:oligopeptide transport system ATP-binding protein
MSSNGRHPPPAQSPTSASSSDETLLDVRDLTMHFPVYRGSVIQRKVGSIQAVDHVSFKIRRGETLGLVGESGCGKSTTGRCIIQLNKPTSGEIVFRGQDLCKLKGTELRRMRRHLQIIFQDPYSSLNPRMTVLQILSEPMEIHGIGSSQAEREDRVDDLLETVGLSPTHAHRYPHEFSGGQRQRIGFARALAVEPDFIVCDEPVSALDVSIQAQIINLLEQLQAKFGLTYLFIAHDLSVVRHISDDVAVMYLGKIVETAPRRELYEAPLHPYARALLSAVPVPDPKVEAKRQRLLLPGDVPSPLNPPSGCRFHPRCPWAEPECARTEPELSEAALGHSVACLYWREVAGGKPARVA